MFVGTPEKDDIQQPKDTSPKKEPLALEKTLQGMRDGQSIIQSDLNSLNHKLSQKGAIFGALMDITNVLETFEVKLKNESKKTRKLLGQAFFGKKARAKEITPEAKLEESVAAAKASKVEDKQTSLLSAINENILSSVKESSIWKFITENWGKLLAGFAVLTLDYKYWDTIGGWIKAFWKQPIWLQLTELAGAYIGWKALETTILKLPGLIKDILITGIAIKWAEAAGFLPKGLGGTIISGANLLVIASLIGKMIFDGFKGYHEKWAASGFSKAIGGALAGTGEGSWVKAAMRGAGGAYLGFKIGMFTPFGIYGAIAGMIIGGAIGAIAGFFGGEKVSKWLDGVGKAISTAWNDMTDWFDYDAYKIRAKEWGGQLSEKIDNFIESTLSSVWDTITNFLKSTWEGIKSFGSDTKAAWNAMREGRGGFKEKTAFTAPPTKYGEDQKSKDYLAELRKKQAEEKTAKKVAETSEVEARVRGTKTPLIIKPSQILIADQRTNRSGWSGLTAQSKLNSQMMANMFGGLRITSGHRSQQRQAQAMIAKGSLDVYGNWFDKAKLSKKERTSAPGSQDRINAVAKIQNAGFESRHRHGNAIDFSTPDAYRGRIPALRALLEDTFPGSKLLEEGNHMHLAFKPGVSPDQLSEGMNKIHSIDGSRTFAGAPANYNVNYTNVNAQRGGDTNIMSPPIRDPKTTN